MNIKTKIMTAEEQPNFNSNNEYIEIVKGFVCLDSVNKMKMSANKSEIWILEWQF